MENIRTAYIPVGQAVRINRKGEKIARFIGNHKVGLTIGSVSITLLVSYGILITKFIHLIKILS